MAHHTAEVIKVVVPPAMPFLGIGGDGGDGVEFLEERGGESEVEGPGRVVGRGGDVAGSEKVGGGAGIAGPEGVD